MQTFLAELLRAGNDVLTKKLHKSGSCPLCLQPKDTVELQSEINARLQEIIESSKKKASFDNAKNLVNSITIERLKRLDSLTTDAFYNAPPNKGIRDTIVNLKNKLALYQKASIEKVTSGNKIPTPETLQILDSIS